MNVRTQQELVAILPRLRRFALGLTRNGTEADDLVQAACEKAITRIDQWEQGTRLDSWMFRIIQTTHIDQIRSQKRRSAYLEVIENQGEQSFDGENAMEANLTLDNVRRAIYNLPEEQRAVVMLVSVEGLSYKEASDVLEIPMGTLTSRLVRARTALTRMIDNPGDADGVTADKQIPPLERGAQP
ncbi:RNA polymerase sigma factor [Magnetovibrio sp.]|uniref:RNA polymerase sigma factor n=1 Tax=Magnetovibrio sp. TaxID=2024836 RepID=UPI002F92B009